MNNPTIMILTMKPSTYSVLHIISYLIVRSKMVRIDHTFQKRKASFSVLLSVLLTNAYRKANMISVTGLDLLYTIYY